MLSVRALPEHPYPHQRPQHTLADRLAEPEQTRRLRAGQTQTGHLRELFSNTAKEPVAGVVIAAIAPEEEPTSTGPAGVEG
jgi:hypothetical protein